MDQKLQIKQNHVEFSDLFESNDENVHQMSQEKCQTYLNIQEGPEIEIISSNLAQSTDTLINVEVQSSVNVNIPLLGGKDASCSCVKCCKKYNEESHFNNHMMTYYSKPSKKTAYMYEKCLAPYKKKLDPNQKINKGRSATKYYLKFLDFCWDSKLLRSKHICLPCMIVFINDNSFLLHARKYHVNDGIVIKTTNIQKSNRFKLTIIAKSKDDDSKYSCDSSEELNDQMDCYECYQREYTIKENVNDKYDVAHMCLRCGLFFKYKRQLEIHSEHHKAPTNIQDELKCLICSTIFDSIDNLFKHIYKIHYGYLYMFPCKICRLQCVSECRLRIHSLKFHVLDNKCKECDKKLCTKKCAGRHMLMHGRKGVFCDTCGLEVASKQELIYHKKRHTTAAENSLRTEGIACHICDKVFKTKHYRMIHMRTHTGERPYKCRYCVKTFAEGGSLKKHERIHTGEKPYACPICPKAFNQRVVLRDHIQENHANSKPRVIGQIIVYDCEVCDNSFRSASKLGIHLIEHSDENTAKARIISGKSCLQKGDKQKETSKINPKNCEETLMPKEVQAVQSSIIDQDGFPYNPTQAADFSSEFPVQTIKMNNNNPDNLEDQVKIKPFNDDGLEFTPHGFKKICNSNITFASQDEIDYYLQSFENFCKEGNMELENEIDDFYIDPELEINFDLFT